jgi:hypothetical protein
MAWWNSLLGYAVETWEHTSIAQQACVVERRFYRCEHITNCYFGSVHSVTCNMLFPWGKGPGEGKPLPTVPFRRMREQGAAAQPQSGYL